MKYFFLYSFPSEATYYQKKVLLVLLSGELKLIRTVPNIFRMKNCWYADNRDLIKWSVLMHLAIVNSASRILQIAYFQEHTFPTVELDKEEKEGNEKTHQDPRQKRQFQETVFYSLIKIIHHGLQDFTT